MKDVYNNSDKKFIPTMEEWWKLYLKWGNKLESSLWRYGSKDDRHEAVMDVFLRIMGVHPKLKLRDPLEPKCEGQWYVFIRYQVLGRLSNMHRHNDRAQGFSTSDEEEIGVFGVEDYKIDAVCQHDLRATIRAVIRKICREQGFSEKTIAGFFASKISGLSGREIVDRVSGITSEDSLYVGNKRVFDRLKAIAKDPSSELYALWAA